MSRRYGYDITERERKWLVRLFTLAKINPSNVLVGDVTVHKNFIEYREIKMPKAINPRTVEYVSHGRTVRNPLRQTAPPPRAYPSGISPEHAEYLRGVVEAFAQVGISAQEATENIARMFTSK